MDRILSRAQGFWDKLGKIKLTERQLLRVFLLAFILMLIPMLIIARYDVPCVDDFGYGQITHAAWLETHSILSVLKAAVQQVKTSYTTWQGSFSAIFAFSLQPAIFGEKWYFFTPFITLFSLLGGIALFCSRLFAGAFGASKQQTGIITIIISAICTQLLPSASQGFYWYNGAVYYTFFFGLSLMLYAAVIAYCLPGQGPSSGGKRLCQLILISLLSIVVGGANLVTALTAAIVYTCVLFAVAVKKDRKQLWLLVPFALFMAAFLCNILAPGNAIRQASEMSDHPSMILAIFLSFRTAAAYIQRWLTIPFICLMVFLVPLLYKIVSRTTYQFRFPLIVLGFSFCLIAAEFCPPVYSIDYMPDRLTDIVFYSFVIVSVFDLFYLLGWARRVISSISQEDQSSQGVYSLSFAISVCAVFLAGCLFTTGVSYTSASAAFHLLNGNASAYYETAQTRFAILRDEPQKDVVLPPFPAKPPVLYFDDITTDPADFRNTTMGDYYNKNSVILGDGLEQNN